MPYTPPPNLSVISNKKQRREMQELLWEKAVLSYSFSYKKLRSMLAEAGVDEDDTAAQLLQDCITAFDAKQLEQAKEDINDRIAEILLDIDQTSLRAPDPFGKEKDLSMFPSQSTSFSRDKALQVAPTFGVTAETLNRIFDRATSKKDIVIIKLQAVRKKEDESE